jgi:hypothetical protein
MPFSAVAGVRVDKTQRVEGVEAVDHLAELLLETYGAVQHLTAGRLGEAQQREALVQRIHASPGRVGSRLDPLGVHRLEPPVHRCVHRIEGDPPGVGPHTEAQELIVEIVPFPVDSPR